MNPFRQINSSHYYQTLKHDWDIKDTSKTRGDKITDQSYVIGLKLWFWLPYQFSTFSKPEQSVPRLLFIHNLIISYKISH